MGEALPTMLVRWRKSPDRIVRINVSDYDAAVYLPLEAEQDVPPVPPPQGEAAPTPSVARRGRRR